MPRDPSHNPFLLEVQPLRDPPSPQRVTGQVVRAFAEVLKNRVGLHQDLPLGELKHRRLTRRIQPRELRSRAGLARLSLSNQLLLVALAKPDALDAVIQFAHG